MQIYKDGNMLYDSIDNTGTANNASLSAHYAKGRLDTLEGNFNNYFNKTEVLDLLAQKVGAEFVDQLPADLTTNVWYYSKKYADGTAVANDKRALYTKDANDVVQYLGVMGEVNLEDYATIADNNERYQQKITDSTISTLTDTSLVSDTNATAKTNSRFTLATLWTWITGKLKTAISSSLTNTDIPSGKAVYDYAVPKTTSASKVYGTNGSGDAYNFDRVTSISSSSTDAQFPTAKALYSYAVPKTSDSNKVYGSSTNYTASDTYTSTASNQLLTRAGAYNLYNAYCAVSNGTVTLASGWSGSIKWVRSGKVVTMYGEMNRTGSSIGS